MEMMRIMMRWMKCINNSSSGSDDDNDNNDDDDDMIAIVTKYLNEVRVHYCLPYPSCYLYSRSTLDSHFDDMQCALRWITYRYIYIYICQNDIKSHKNRINTFDR